ncbi:MAG: DUF3810 domain-containing protein [Candidatus Pseudobacter hemicellulosilyticus]|uniref:DUF3810 domain-containing protein n=1 Tax=Candidatus Pseudobacter hemicellulosilyticus TaxID=3121375 RepID=A0AAJ5WKY5_9BACT|nr:MAG: DUF3810 domain-containing protein [Pseudobacter sp.]
MWKKYLPFIIPALLALIIRVFSGFPQAVEQYYSQGLYPVLGGALRILFGWLPISLGDLLYLFAGLWLLRKLIILVKKLWKRQTGKAYWLRGLRQGILVVLWVYVLFNGLWGLNYNRVGLARQLDLTIEEYRPEELKAVMEVLVERLHDLDSSGRVNRTDMRRKRFLFRHAKTAYDSLAVQWPAFSYSFRSVKPSLYSYLGNYLGFTGYYNPFSGEAQVNTTVPVFVQPFTTCHEIGHQLGYAKENEANFAGYLAARSSADAAFRYSVYYDMYSYSWNYFYRFDSVQAKAFNAQLPAGVIRDHKEWREFLLRHRNPVEAVIDKLYGEYLRANQQPSGKMTYSEVVAWLVAWYRKYGAEAI